MTTNLGAGKTPCWAGATPLLGASGCPKRISGSLQPAPSSSGPCFAAQESGHASCNAACNTSCLKRGEKTLALLKAPSKQPKTTTVQVRLEEEVRRILNSTLSSSTQTRVTSRAKRSSSCSDRDEEFRCWLGHHTNDHNQEQTQGDALTKTAWQT